MEEEIYSRDTSWHVQAQQEFNHTEEHKSKQIRSRKHQTDTCMAGKIMALNKLYISCVKQTVHPNTLG